MYIALLYKSSFCLALSIALSIGIKVRDNESIDRALRRFKRAVNKSRVLRIFREKMAYVKPSETRREEKISAMRNSRRYSRPR